MTEHRDHEHDGPGDHIDFRGADLFGVGQTVGRIDRQYVTVHPGPTPTGDDAVDGPVDHPNQGSTKPYARARILVAIGVAIAGVVFGAWRVVDGHRAADEPLSAISSWPTYATCDGATEVAMSPGGREISSFTAHDRDFRSTVTRAEGGGTWGPGHLYLHLSARDDKVVSILGITLATTVPAHIDPPEWVARTRGGCGDTYNRVMALDLDRPSLVDQGVLGEPETADTPAAPGAPLGPGFTVSAKAPADVRVDVTACAGNYVWSLRVDYEENGDRYRKEIGPFRTMSVPGPNTVAYTPDHSGGETRYVDPTPLSLGACERPR